MDYFIYGILLGIIMYMVSSFMRKFNDLKEEHLNQQLSKIEKILHIVKIEKHGDYYYWYDDSTDDFLAQGKTEEEVIKILSERFPRHHFLFVDEEEVITERICAPLWKREAVNI